MAPGELRTPSNSNLGPRPAHFLQNRFLQKRRHCESNTHPLKVPALMCRGVCTQTRAAREDPGLGRCSHGAREILHALESGPGRHIFCKIDFLQKRRHCESNTHPLKGPAPMCRGVCKPPHTREDPGLGRWSHSAREMLHPLNLGPTHFFAKCSV